MLDWWQRVTRRRPEPPPGRTPAQRYRLALMRGESEASARHTVASSYGLNTNVVRLGTDGSERLVTIAWTVRDIERLLFAKYLVAEGIVTEWPK